MGRTPGHESKTFQVQEDQFYRVLDGYLHISDKVDPHRTRKMGERYGLLCDERQKKGARPFAVELISYDVHDTCQNIFNAIEGASIEDVMYGIEDVIHGERQRRKGGNGG